ncbi:MAG: M28 family peptidase [Thermoplasmatota archaeon]
MRVLVLLFVALLAGCVSNEDSTPEPDLATPSLDAPQVDVKAAVDWWEHISTAYPKHDTYTPTNDDLRDHLVSELEGLGMEVEVRTYQALPRDSAPVPVANPVTTVDAIIATKQGAWAKAAPDAPEHRMGLVSHYDTQTATVHGAYDDKSGVAAEFHICKALLEVEMNRTLSCIFFDAEEQGLIASQRYVEDIQDETDDYVYDMVLGYDMTGINWPGHDWKMYLMTGPAEDIPWLQALGQEVLHGQLGYPESGVEVLDTHDRNSDERRFKEAGIPIYRFAGGRHAADYPQYHMPQDTVEYVYEFVDGRANFEAGFGTILEGSIHLALALDQATLDELRA